MQTSENVNPYLNGGISMTVQKAIEDYKEHQKSFRKETNQAEL
jgi:hypothetical protein